MSEATSTPASGNHQGGFERQDLGAKAVLTFLGTLAAICVVVYFLMRVLYGYMDAYERAHQPALNPLKPRVEAIERNEEAGQTREQIERVFPEPRLEENERTELRDFRLHEEEQLNSYGWVDQPAGVVHIPIERAMQLTVQRGLPELPANAAGAQGTGAPPKRK